MRKTRTVFRRSQEPLVRPVKNIEISDEFPKLRLFLTVVFLLVGVSALTYGVTHLSSREAGWQEIEVSSSEYNCGDDFVFLYNLGQGSASATAEYKALSALYSEAAEHAFAVFTCDVEYEDVFNMYYLNRHPNEEIEVDAVLYRALEAIQSSGNRSLYLGAAYEYYNGLFRCEEDYQAEEYDPRRNEAAAKYYAAVAAFARDASAIDIELLGDNRVCLKVSEEYLAFIEENEIEKLVDFYWMTDAFIADYLAEELILAGYTRGVLSSRDGFVRNLDGSGTEYVYDIYDRDGTEVSLAAELQYSGVTALVYLHDFMLDSGQQQYYYTFSDGAVCTPYLDTADAYCRNACSSLICYSYTGSCAEVLLQMLPVYIADTLNTEALTALSGSGVYSVYTLDGQLFYTDPELEFTAVYTDGAQLLE